MESKIQNKLIRSLEAAGAFCLKVSVCNKPGYPDVTAFMPDGTVEFYEVKQPGKKPRPLQEYRLKELSKYGKCYVYDGTAKRVCSGFEDQSDAAQSEE
jgi:hypothetical protein